MGGEGKPRRETAKKKGGGAVGKEVGRRERSGLSRL